jgi:hypothetical protein
METNLDRGRSTTFFDLSKQARPLDSEVMKSALLVLLAIGSLALASGCAKVAPYERGMLAHPTMTPEEISIGLDGHVRAVSEGAAGGLGGGGGGCGCN